MTIEEDLEETRNALRNHYCNNLRSHREALTALSRIEAERDHYRALAAERAEYILKRDADAI